MRAPSLRGVVIAIAVASIVLGFFAGRILDAFGSASTRAAWFARAGRWGRVERVWFAELEAGHRDAAHVIAFLEAHERARVHVPAPKPPKDDERSIHDLRPPPDEPEAPIDEAEIDAFFHDANLDPDVAAMVDVLRDDDDSEGTSLARVVALADRDPPAPWANHVLADQVAVFPEDAVARYEREGVAFQRRADIERAIDLREAIGGSRAVDEALDDPRIGPLAPAWTQLHRAIERRDYGRAARWLLPAAYEAPEVGTLALTLVAALAWAFFLGRFGQFKARPLFRAPLYLAAFALGVLSIAPTTFLIEWQAVVLHVTQDGTPARDAVFFTFGVGFREELSKLLCFLPLVPILRARGNALDVLACGAFVGLGFAATENLGYFAHDAASVALARFLSANFLHMAMTGSIAVTAFAMFAKRREEDAFYRFTVTFLLVAALHGAYDYLLEASRASLLAMGVLFYLARRFFLEMHEARMKVGRSEPLLPTFAIGMITVVGACFVFAASIFGPGLAATFMFVGLLGSFILTGIFVTQLRNL